MKYLLPIVLLLAACSGGGGGGGPPPVPIDNAPATLTWQPPTQFEDNTTLDVGRDVGLYEIHISYNAGWTDNTACAVVNPIDNLGNLTTTFDLRNLYPFGISPGYNGTYLTMRSIGIDNSKSQFGIPCWWEAR